MDAFLFLTHFPHQIHPSNQTQNSYLVVGKIEIRIQVRQENVRDYSKVRQENVRDCTKVRQENVNMFALFVDSIVTFHIPQSRTCAFSFRRN